MLHVSPLVNIVALRSKLKHDFDRIVVLTGSRDRCIRLPVSLWCLTP